MLSDLSSLASLLNRNQSFGSRDNIDAQKTHGQTDRNQSITSGLFNSSGIQTKTSLGAFNTILERSYQHLANSFNIAPVGIEPGASPISEYISYTRVEPISSQQASETILNFISAKIKSDEANGANQDELMARLDEGLRGFKKGFNEAKDQIEGLGLLTDKLSNEIAETYSNVTSGIDDIREQILAKTDTSDSTSHAQALPSALVSQSRIEAEHSVSSSFSLQLTTQDGDQVTIDISRKSRTSASARVQNENDTSRAGINLSSESQSSFHLSVSGKLDAKELAAIDQLLNDVDEIAIDFYAGKLDEAFAHATELDMDRSELSQLNLQLSNTTVTRALAAYESNAYPLAEDVNQFSSKDSASELRSDSLSPFRELELLLDNIENIVKQAKQYSESFSLLDGLISEVSNQYTDSDAVIEENIEISDGKSLPDLFHALIKKFDIR